MTNSICSNICDVMEILEKRGLNTGATGNISVKSEDAINITPSGLCPAELGPEKIVSISISGEYRGIWKPSSEWRIHTEIYKRYIGVGAVIHMHSPYATALSCHCIDVPAFHYMVGAIGGDNIRCASYETFGTKKLSEVVVVALQERMACLMANHGMLAVGPDLSSALGTAVLVEELSKQYLLSKAIGEPILISKQEMSVVVDKFQTYGSQNV